MMCSLIDFLPIPGYNLACTQTGIGTTLAGLLAALVVLLCLAWGIRIARKPIHRAGAVLIAFAAFFLAVAAGVPTIRPIGPALPGGRIVVLLDQSESVRRQGDRPYNAARATLVQRLRESVAERDPKDWSGRIIGFGDRPEMLSGEVPVDRLASTASGASAGPPAGSSDLAAGLSAALDWIAEGDGGGEIFLLTDGWFTETDSTPEIARAAGRGVPIHVLAYGPENGAQGLLAWNLGPVQYVGREAIGRLVTRGEGKLIWSANGEAGEPVALAPGPQNAAPRAVRLPVTFQKRGFSHLTARIETKESAGRGIAAFTMVRGPARVLVYGLATWAEGLPRERYLVTRAAPRDQVVLSDFDVLAVDGLEPTAFAPDFTAEALKAAAGGTGLFLVNGPQRGSKEDAQRMADWEETDLDPILPVNSDPSSVFDEPPPRTVLIIIDTSGSMVGEFASVAINSANRVIDFLRPGDSLTILPFSDGVGQKFSANSLDVSSIEQARRYLAGIGFGGGTNMTPAINAAASLRGTNCDLFVIGDGGYDAGQVNTSPICRTTAIGVAGIELPGFDTSWGEQKPLRPGEELGEITFETFKPQERLEFWRDGPLPLRPVDPPSDFDTAGTVQGIALSYARPEAEIVLIPQAVPPDPVLVFREDLIQRGLKSGVFMGDMGTGIPRETVMATLDWLTGWSEPDRFDITLSLDGNRLTFNVATVEDWPVPPQLSLSLRFADGRSVGLDTSSGVEAGLFKGTRIIDLPSNADSAILILETGDSPTKYIPIHLPGRGSFNSTSSAVREGESVGVNTAMLRVLLDMTRGTDLSRSSPRYSDRATADLPIAIWAIIASLALCLFTAGLWLGAAKR